MVAGVGLPIFATIQGNATPSSSAIDFDIPAEPLETALDAFGAISRMHVLYETGLTAGLRSAGIKGSFTADEALRRLLSGTPLAVRYTGPRSYTLVAMPPDDAPAKPVETAAAGAPPSRPQRRDFRHFLGGVQAGITDRLCGDPLTRPGHYRVALQFWISASGSLEWPTLLGSSGDRARDAAIAAGLKGLAFSETPPADMPQPVTMIVVPRTDAGHGCPMATP